MVARKICRALYELMEDEIREREERGEKRGEEKILISLVKDGLLSPTEAAKRLSITEEELEQKLSTV